MDYTLNLPESVPSSHIETDKAKLAKNANCLQEFYLEGLEVVQRCTLYGNARHTANTSVISQLHIATSLDGHTCIRFSAFNNCVDCVVMATVQIGATNHNINMLNKTINPQTPDRSFANSTILRHASVNNYVYAGDY